MAKQKLLRMAFTRSDVMIVYRSLSDRLKAIQTEADGRPSVAALEAVDVDAIMKRIVKAIAAMGGMDVLANVAPDPVAAKHARRVRKSKAGAK